MRRSMLTAAVALLLLSGCVPWPTDDDAMVIHKGPAGTAVGSKTFSVPSDDTFVVPRKPSGALGNRVLKVLEPYDENMPPFYISDPDAVHLGVQCFFWLDDQGRRRSRCEVITSRRDDHEAGCAYPFPPGDPLAIGVCPDVIEDASGAITVRGGCR